MSVVPYRFLFRTAHPCRYVADIPREAADDLLDLPAECRIDGYTEMDGQRSFADVRLAWNESGIAVQVQVAHKEQDVVGDASRPRHSDGVTLWLDTRGARTSHRASRYCHQFHFLAAGGGPERDEPIFVQSKIHRAQQDAPFAPAGSVAFQCLRRGSGYVLEAFLPAAALTGFDPEQNPRLGFHYAVHDHELGNQTLSVGTDFPVADDPSLWSVLELVRPAKRARSRSR